MTNKRQTHWDNVYTNRAHDDVSWFAPRLSRSIALIERFAQTSRSPFRLIDIGAGASTLVDEAVERGWEASALDISRTALAISEARLGDKAKLVDWIVADATRLSFAEDTFDAWHDRAVFHFLTDAEDRAGYLRALRRALSPDGIAIIAAFALDGPEECSDLPVMRYSAESLADELGEGFELLHSEVEPHLTPKDKVQSFVYTVFRRV